MLHSRLHVSLADVVFLSTQKLISSSSSLSSVTGLFSVHSNSEEAEHDKFVLSSKANSIELNPLHPFTGDPHCLPSQSFPLNPI